MSAPKVHSDAQQTIEKLKVESRKLKIDTEKVKKQIEELKAMEAKWKTADVNSRANESKLKQEEEYLKSKVNSTQRTIKYNEEWCGYEEMEMNKEIEEMKNQSEQWKKMYEGRCEEMTSITMEGDIKYDMDFMKEYIKKGGHHYSQAQSFRDKFLSIATEEKDKKKVEREFRNFQLDMDLLLVKVKENIRMIKESDDKDGFWEMKPFPVPFSDATVTRYRQYEDDNNKKVKEAQEKVRENNVATLASLLVARSSAVASADCYGGIEQQSPDCSICSQPIYTKFEVQVCRMCQTHTHISCFHRTTQNNQCHHCQYSVKPCFFPF